MNASPNPFFSVVIPAYNYARYLPMAIQSVLEQGENNFEIIVVDDGSTDSTLVVAQEFMSRSSRRMTYVHQDNRGLASARNHGVRLSRGEYLLFLDADDALLPDALNRFRSAIGEAGEGIDFVYGGRVLVSQDGKETTFLARKHLASNELNFVRYVKDGFQDICAGCAVIKQRVFTRLQFQENIRTWEDVVFHAQLFGLFYGLSFPDPVVRIYRHADSLSHNSDLFRNDLPKTVELLFDPVILPAHLLTHRELYRCLTQASLFAHLYERGFVAEATEVFRGLIRTCPGRAMQWKMLRRYIGLVLGLSRRRSSPSESRTTTSA